MIKRKLLATLVVWVLTGCSINTYNIGAQRIEPESIPVAGQTYTLADALSDFGPPQRLSAIPGGYVLAWEYWHIRQEKLGISLSPIGVEFLSIDWGDAQTQGDFLVLGFHVDHEMRNVGYGRWNSSVGGGQGIQPLFGVVDVVDVDDLTSAMPQHNWGGFGLNELPVALNIDNHLDTGGNGIQQRGTTSAVGQHSLEMRPQQ